MIHGWKLATLTAALVLLFAGSAQATYYDGGTDR